ncbi:MAG: hypothetical protein ACRD3F_01835 [Acidobacteriaceae bacterium]
MQSQGEPLYHVPEMVRYIKIFLAILCIVCILALCIAPNADIPVSILKALQFVIMLMFALISSMLLLAGAFHLVIVQMVVSRTGRKCPTRSLFLPIESNCVQQV